MLKRYLGAIAGLALFTSASAGQAEDFLEIKGFHVGMKSWEFKAHQTDFCYMEGCFLSPNKTFFTVGGVKGRFFGVSYNDSAEVAMAEFTFDSLQFDHLRTALIEKYPRAKCSDSEVITRLGRRVPQMVCGFETAKDGIYLVRVAGNINRSLMFVMSAEKRKDLRDHIAAANKDL
jgi:hypothetical protein